MSSVVLHPAPVAHRRHMPSLFRRWRRRRRAGQVFVAILHAADLPPGS